MGRELIIEKTEGASDWVHLDLGGEVPAMVFQINDLNDLKDRQTSYSQALALPITPNNCRVFGFANDFQARSASPYTTHRCAWYEDGIQVIGTNYRLELLSVSDTFNCQIVSNLLGLFETLQGLPMDALNLTPQLWSAEEIARSSEIDNEQALIAWAIPISTQKSIGVYGRVSYYFLAADMMLYFRLLPLVREILRQAGYSLDTDIEGVPGYVADCISLADIRPGEHSMEPLEGVARGSAFVAGVGNTYPVYLLSYTESNTFNYGEANVVTWVPDIDVPSRLTKGYEYIAPGNMKCHVHMDAVSFDNTDTVGRVRYRIQRIAATLPSTTYEVKQEVIASVDARVSRAAQPNSYTSELIELSAGDRVYVEVILLDGKQGVAYQGSFGITIPHEENAVPAGGYIYPHLSTDFKSQLDVIKLFVQLYGLFVDIDNNSKVFKAYNLEQIVGRIDSNDFSDWSDKIDRARTHETTFRIGAYEQNNRILFGANSLLGVQDSGTITVNNTNLKLSKDLFTLPVESTKNGETVIIQHIDAWPQAADIDVRYTSDDGTYRIYDTIPPAYITLDSVLISKYRASKTHVVQRQQATAYTGADWTLKVHMIPYGVPVLIPYQQCYAAVGIPPSHYVDTFYKILSDNILNPSRVVEAMFNLTAIDIENLDLLRPVYIEYYGAFFYIQKINNYQAGRLTKVTLVCLNAANN